MNESFIMYTTDHLTPELRQGRTVLPWYYYYYKRGLSTDLQWTLSIWMILVNVMIMI